MPNVIHTAEFESAFGTIRVASSEQGLAYVGLPLVNGRGFMGWLDRHGGEGAKATRNFAANRVVVTQLQDFIEGKRESLDVALDVRATDFQRSVYEVVRTIPFGETRTYGEIAREVESVSKLATSPRAVGAALGANPLPIVIPCHRVIAAGGRLQGYVGGLEAKARLLAGEKAGPESGRLF